MARGSSVLALEHIRLEVKRGHGVPGATELAASFRWPRAKAGEALTALTAEGLLRRAWMPAGPGQKSGRYVYELAQEAPCN